MGEGGRAGGVGEWGYSSERASAGEEGREVEEREGRRDCCSDGSAPNAYHGSRDAASKRGDGDAIRALTTTGTFKFFSVHKMAPKRANSLCQETKQKHMHNTRVLLCF